MNNGITEVYVGWCIMSNINDQTDRVQDTDVFDTLNDAFEYIQNGCEQRTNYLVEERGITYTVFDANGEIVHEEIVHHTN